jgi:hypothetical protein
MMRIYDFNIPWPTFWIVLGLVIAGLVLWTLNRRENTYHVLDLLMEGEPKRASVNNHILVGFALLSVWLVIMKTFDTSNEIPDSVGNLLLGVLGIFVVGRVAGQAVYTAGATATKKAAIQQGRMTDVPDETVEEQEARLGKKERRRSKLLE